MKKSKSLLKDIGGYLSAINRKQDLITSNSIKLSGKLGVIDRDVLESNTKRLERQIVNIQELLQTHLEELSTRIKSFNYGTNTI